MDFLRYFAIVPDVVDFLGDLVTAILGSIAIWGFVAKRKELTELFTALVRTHLDHKVHRIKETLGRLESLRYDDKESRPEINALLGQLTGQLAPVILYCDELVPVLLDLQQIMSKKLRVNESRKRMIIYTIHGHLDLIHVRKDLKNKNHESSSRSHSKDDSDPIGN